MLIPDNIERNFYVAVSETLGWPRIVRITDDTTGFMLNYDIAKEIVENADKIMELIPKTQRKIAEKLIAYMRDNLDKIAKTIATGSDDINTLVLSFVLSKISEVRVDYDKAVEKLVKYLPIRVMYTRGSRTVHGYALNPTPKERERIKEYDKQHVDVILWSIARAVTRLDFERNTAKLYGLEIPLTEKGVYLLAKALDRWDEALKYVRERAKELIKYWVWYDKLEKVTDASDGIQLKIKPEEFEKAVTSHAGKGEPGVFKVNNVTIDVSLDADLTYRLSITVRGENIAFYKEKWYDKDFRRTLVESLGSLLYDAIDYTVKYAPLVAHTKKLATLYGYNVKESYGYYMPFSLRLEKTHKNANIRLVLDMPEKIKEARAVLTVAVDKGLRRINAGAVREYLSRRGINEGNIDVYGKTIRYTLEYQIDDLEEALVAGEKVAEALTDFLVEYERKLKTIKVATPIDTEAYVALYLAKNLAGMSLNIEELIGRPEGVVYSTVARVLRNLDPKIINELKRESWYWGDRGYLRNGYRVAKYLFKYGYVTVDKEGNVLVNGKNVVELLEKANLPAPIGVQVESSILTAYLDYLHDKAYASRKSLTDILREMGYVTPEFVSKLISLDRLPSLDLLLDEYESKPIWWHLDDARKILLVQSGVYYKLEEILNNDRLIELFKPYKELIIRQASKSDEVLLLRSILAFDPGVIGVAGDVKLHEEAKMLAIDAGDYLVVPYRVEEPKADADKWFLVFRKQDKLGIMVKAKTVSEAVEHAPQAFSDARRELAGIKKAWGDKVKLTKEQYRGSGYSLVWLYVEHVTSLDIPHERYGPFIRVVATPGLKQVLDSELERLTRKEEELEELSG